MVKYLDGWSVRVRVGGVRVRVIEIRSNYGNENGEGGCGIVR